MSTIHDVPFEKLTYHMKHLITCLLSFLVLSITAQSDLSPELIKNIEERIAYQLNPSIVIGVVDKDGPRYYNFGGKTLGASDADEHTIYEIGSVSKTFTGILLADQVRRGSMKLTDPIKNYLPERVELPTYKGKEITLGHLADHTSALPRMPDNFNPSDPANPYADYTPELLYEFLSNVQLQREIGSEFEYSNLAQGLLGHILELHTGRTFDELMYERICVPLGMHETAVKLNPTMKQNLATPYNGVTEASNWDIKTLTGAGGVRSSVADMLLYLQANLGLTESPLYPAMQMSHRPRHNKLGNNGIGLAWFIEPSDDDGLIIQHGGATGGYLTFAAMDMVNKKGVIVFTNTGTNGAEDVARYILGKDMNLSTPRRSFLHALQLAQKNDSTIVAMDFYHDMIAGKEDLDFDENQLNSYGYVLLGQEKIDDALDIFEINIAQHPNSSNPYDSYAEALMKKSIENYKKSIELNPNNQNAIDMLAKMGVEMEQEAVAVSQDDILPYVGSYEIAPGFDIVVTTEGNRIFAQATGQQRFELFPISKTKFFLKVVDAQVEFFENEEGIVDKIVLYQNGVEMPGMRKSEE